MGDLGWEFGSELYGAIATISLFEFNGEDVAASFYDILRRNPGYYVVYHQRGNMAGAVAFRGPAAPDFKPRVYTPVPQRPLV